MILENWVQIPKQARPKIRYWLPGAAVEDDDLRKEIRSLYERGFGGIEVSCMMKLPSLAMGETAWGTQRWNHMVEVIAEETERLGMTMDLTNGPMWPISMPTIDNIDSPAVSWELTYGWLPTPLNGVYEGPLPRRQTVRPEGKAKLLAVMAYLEDRKGVLVSGSYRNLNHCLIAKKKEEGAQLSCRLPIPEEGKRWLIFAFYMQPTAEKTSFGKYYVIDHFSREGADACVRYWEPILKKYGDFPSMESFFCDSMEYQASMEWTPALPEEFKRRRGYDIFPWLPFLHTGKVYPVPDVPGFVLDDEKISDMVNQDYLETLTQCYCENHLDALEKMAVRHRKTIRYQVAYNKPLEAERSALYVGVPENEALGRASMDRMKTMAAAAHLGRKERYSFECAAEYGNAYGQDYEDLFWWVKRSLMAGMNAQVLHGASYSGTVYGMQSEGANLSGIQWPGFEAFRKAVSNYWNRTLSAEDARGCMDTIARMNTLFLKKAKVDCAVYRQNYGNPGEGNDDCLYPDGGVLIRAGYSYEFVSPALLDLPVCRVKNGILDPDGVGYKCLIIPQQRAVSLKFLRKLAELTDAGLLVVWQGEKPEHPLYYADWKDAAKKDEWQWRLDKLWKQSAEPITEKQLPMAKVLHVEELYEIPNVLKQNNIEPEVWLDGNENIMTAVRVDEERHMKYFMLYAGHGIDCTPECPNPESFGVSGIYRKGTTKPSYERPDAAPQRIFVKLKEEGLVYQCNPWNGSMEPLDFWMQDKWNCGYIEIEEDELVILALYMQERKIPVSFSNLTLESFEPDREGEHSFLRSHFTGKKQEIELDGPAPCLLPWNKLPFTGMDFFAGRGVYTARVSITELFSQRHWILHLVHVCDTFRVRVNGKETDFPNQVKKTADITKLLQKGENLLEIIVVSNLYNRVVGMQKDQPDLVFKVPFPYKEKNYGIWGECWLEVR